MRPWLPRRARGPNPVCLVRVAGWFRRLGRRVEEIELGDRPGPGGGSKRHRHHVPTDRLDLTPLLTLESARSALRMIELRKSYPRR